MRELTFEGGAKSGLDRVHNGVQELLGEYMLGVAADTFVERVHEFHLLYEVGRWLAACCLLEMAMNDAGELSVEVEY